MKSYEHFLEEDFISDPAFQAWVLQPNEENDAFWNAFIKNFPHKKPVIDQAAKQVAMLAFPESRPSDEKVEAFLQAALQKINEEKNGGKVIRVKPFYKWLSVAAVLLLVAGGGYLLTRQKQTANSPGDQLAKNLSRISHNILLTLSDGRTIILDSAANGNLASQGGVAVEKQDGLLSYKQEGNKGTEIVYNTVSTPKGGQYQLVLADGTKVWLNTSSSLKFTTAFSGTDRFVELQGEGYFEVAHNEKQPFHVMVNHTEVKVLGTHFNINGYADEPVVKTTLLEGRVMVQAGERIFYLNPGQEALASPKNEFLRVRNNVSLDEVMAWKNGKFNFGAATEVHTVMRQLARWYDLDVNYEGNVEGKLGGTLPRTADASQVLKMLAATGIVKFKVNGNKVTVISADKK